MQEWSAETGIAIGAIVPAAQVWRLAHWFDGRLDSAWQPRDREASQKLLTDAGFIGPFWSLTG